MMTALDESVANITDALRARALWANTVLLVVGDNGGPTFEGHSNHPLRGGKLTFFEGGVRPLAFLASPLLPPAVRGGWFNGSLHETDWAATFLSLAGLPAHPQVTGKDCWGAITGEVSQPHRNVTLIGNGVLRWDTTDAAGAAQSVS